MKPQPVNFTSRLVDLVGAEGEVLRVLALVPEERYARVFARQCPEWSEHTMVPFEPRNMAMHRACFAELNELYHNLPETVWYRCDADGAFLRDEHGNRFVRFPTFDHFRSFLLVEENWCQIRERRCLNPQEAAAVAKDYRDDDPFCRVKVDGSTVIAWKAMSQDMGSMTAAQFKDSMDAILARARSYVGVTKAASQSVAGRVA